MLISKQRIVLSKDSETLLISKPRNVPSKDRGLPLCLQEFGAYLKLVECRTAGAIES